MKRFVVLLIATTVLFPLLTAVGGPPPGKKGSQNQTVKELMQEGDTFRSQGKLSGALWAYRRAAKAGDVKGAFAAGELLLQQGQASAEPERILKLSEGLDDLFFAATNGHAHACAALSHALEKGIGVKTNLISAYAWLELAAERDPSFKPDLDRLVVQLAPDAVQQAQVLASKYAQGHWPANLVHPVDQGDSRLRIQGMTGSGRKSLVIINNTSFGVGDSAVVQPIKKLSSDKGELSITCLEIDDGYVLVSIAGESHWKLLSVPLR